MPSNNKMKLYNNQLFRKTTSSFSRLDIPGAGFKELYLTFYPQLRSSGNIESVEEFYDRIAEYLSSLNARVILEHCYAPVTEYNDICLCRNHAFANHGLTSKGNFCFIGESACDPALIIAGTQIWAVCSEKDLLVTPYIVDGKTIGTKFCNNSHCFVSLTCVQPQINNKNNSSRKEQAISMFREVNRLLSSVNLAYKDVLRTWIYIPDLLSWYNKFNTARHKVFQEADIMSEVAPRWLPASTGIQGGSPSGSACMMGALAISRLNGSKVSTEMVSSPGQCEAFEYGSAFSRAVELRDSYSSRMFISGTASIDEMGNTVHKGNIAKQAQHTLTVIKDLLSVKGHDFSDIAHIVTFLKKAKYAPIYRKIAEKEGIDLNCSIETVADVCRDDLLIEIEVMSIKPV